ncbi:Hypothetical predicted protein [Podarcis lilfordi]|uniref:Uncharacterized protein n=1 Tax=Podarcis lilfordi TaxID=74358 RepID=A0AA35JR27_9SAUR|nr:Hypothetical predicted protein [Podarcis lilfordi]
MLLSMIRSIDNPQQHLRLRNMPMCLFESTFPPSSVLLPRCGHTQTQHSGPSSQVNRGLGLNQTFIQILLYLWHTLYFPAFLSRAMAKHPRLFWQLVPGHSQASCLDQPCLLAKPVMDLAGEVEEKGLTPQKDTQGPPPSELRQGSCFGRLKL